MSYIPISVGSARLPGTVSPQVVPPLPVVIPSVMFLSQGSADGWPLMISTGSSVASSSSLPPSQLLQQTLAANQQALLGRMGRMDNAVSRSLIPATHPAAREMEIYSYLPTQTFVQQQPQPNGYYHGVSEPVKRPFQSSGGLSNNAYGYPLMPTSSLMFPPVQNSAALCPPASFSPSTTASRIPEMTPHGDGAAVVPLQALSSASSEMTTLAPSKTYSSKKRQESSLHSAKSKLTKRAQTSPRGSLASSPSALSSEGASPSAFASSSASYKAPPVLLIADDGSILEGLGGQERLQIEFESLGTLPPEGVPIQTFGRQRLPIPDGLCGTHHMYSQSWKFEISYRSKNQVDDHAVKKKNKKEEKHSDSSEEETTRSTKDDGTSTSPRGHLDGGYMAVVCLTWKITNLISGQETCVTETHQQATIRQESGRTISNLVMQRAMEERAKELERLMLENRDAGAHYAVTEDNDNEELSRERKDDQETANTRAIIVKLRPRRCGEGLLFFGLRHDQVHLEHFKRFCDLKHQKSDNLPDHVQRA